jgi:hypothetical protein
MAEHRQCFLRVHQEFGNNEAKSMEQPETIQPEQQCGFAEELDCKERAIAERSDRQHSIVPECLTAAVSFSHRSIQLFEAADFVRQTSAAA